MRAIRRLANTLYTGIVLVRAGVIRLDRPDRIVRTLLLLSRWGPTPASGYAISAMRDPHRAAIHDDAGTIDFRELHEQSNALAHGLRELGVGEGDGIAILCRDHAGFVKSSVAASRLGATLLLLNTSFAGPQIADVCEREEPRVLIYDEEFIELCSQAAQGRTSIIAWHDEPVAEGFRSIDGLVAAGSRANLSPPRDRGRVVILTSGTTGAPKGASRHQPRTLDPAAAFFSRIPLRARETTVISSPLFHSWGYGNFTLALALSSTLVLARRFDPERVLEAIERHRASALITVPVMLQRILDLGGETIRRHDTGSLRVIAVSGSALPGELALRVMDTFGDVLYNLYGSTEVAWATIASPRQLRAAPGTAGTPPHGTRVRLFDDAGEELRRRGETGRIFVHNEMVMDGYTTGDGKAVIAGLIATGDVGFVDREGRLFVSGRDDEMIISGGENVFPREVEDLLANHPAIDEVAVIGVEDREYGERLRAFVVLKPGERLDDEAVRALVRDNLARFKVPRDVLFVDVLPRTATGKVLKRFLDRGE
ncbi:MAG TPA: AMP-binding protein [Solirubrobacteraceae bacterium]|nr:AMP-binding protein [Solirubrobacteraceae bacterium]